MYNIGKLKRLLVQLRLMLQDSIYTMIHKNYYKYYNFIDNYIPEKVEVKSSFEVVNTWKRKPN